jgi:hypothetical protein
MEQIRDRLLCYLENLADELVAPVVVDEGRKERLRWVQCCNSPDCLIPGEKN